MQPADTRLTGLLRKGNVEFRILGELRATGNYRKVAEELWPMVDGGPSTPMGEAELAWLVSRGTSPSKTEAINRP